MSLMAVTSESLTRELSREIPPMYVQIAKHSALGMDDEGIKEVIGCTDEDLHAVLNDGLYREVRIYVGAVHANEIVAQTTGWDNLEGKALKRLNERVDAERDVDTLLRIAAVANKAQRRAKAGQDQGVIDATATGKTAKISLTTRLVRSFDRAGGETHSIEKQVSISDGSIQNPSFDDIDNLLSVSQTPALPRKLEISSHVGEVSFDELDRDMAAKGA